MYADAKAKYPKVYQTKVQFLSEIVGIPAQSTCVLENPFNLDFSDPPFAGQGQSIGYIRWSCQGRLRESPDWWWIQMEGGEECQVTNKLTMTTISGVYTIIWIVYLNKEIEYMSTSPFIDIRYQAFVVLFQSC